MTQHMDGTQARGGWRAEETSILFERVSRADERGIPLRAVFEDVGRELGRKPNSIRNFYYAKVRESPALVGAKKPAFRVFTPEETRRLIAAVLAARANGTSVRACVRELANGDPKEMLRYQNKYRAVLKSNPALLAQIADELNLRGVSASAPEPIKRRGAVGLEEALAGYGQRFGEKKARALADALTALLEAAASPEALNDMSEALEKSREQAARARLECDRLKVQVDLQKLLIEDLQKRAITE